MDDEDKFVWTTEKIDILKVGWWSKSSRVLAKEIGCSHGAVSGKAFRLGLLKGPPQPKLSVIKQSKRMITPRKTYRPPRAVPKLAAEELSPIDAPSSEWNVTLDGLTDTTCRYPLGDPSTFDMFFCGAPADIRESRPYCAYHASICFVAPPRATPRPLWRNQER